MISPKPVDTIDMNAAIAAAKKEMSRIDLHVCGKCYMATYFVEEFNQHKENDTCEFVNKSNLQPRQPQTLSFFVWKNSQPRSADNDHWTLYQKWCKMSEAEKEVWSCAGSHLKEMTAIAQQTPLENGGSSSKRQFSDSEDDVEEEFIAEKLVGKRYNNTKRRVEYLVKWEGFPESQNSWEPISNLIRVCNSMINEYDERMLAKGRAVAPSKANVARTPAPANSVSALSPLKSILGKAGAKLNSSVEITLKSTPPAVEHQRNVKSISNRQQFQRTPFGARWLDDKDEMASLRKKLMEGETSITAVGIKADYASGIFKACDMDKLQRVKSSEMFVYKAIPKKVNRGLLKVESKQMPQCAPGFYRMVTVNQTTRLTSLKLGEHMEMTLKFTPGINGEGVMMVGHIDKHGNMTPVPALSPTVKPGNNASLPSHPTKASAASAFNQVQKSMNAARSSSVFKKSVEMALEDTNFEMEDLNTHEEESSAEPDPFPQELNLEPLSPTKPFSLDPNTGKRIKVEGEPTPPPSPAPVEEQGGESVKLEIPEVPEGVLTIQGEDGNTYLVANAKLDGDGFVVGSGVEDAHCVYATEDGHQVMQRMTEDGSTILTLENNFTNTIVQLMPNEPTMLPDGTQIYMKQDENGQVELVRITPEEAPSSDVAGGEIGDENAVCGELTTPAITITTSGEDGEEQQMTAQLIRSEPPEKEGGFRRVVLLLANGNIIMTEVDEEQFAALEGK